mgnify:CR=1 FL=1
MLIKVFGAAVQGIDATLITIEVNSSRGCMFYLVGLPDSAVKESHQRIISALQVNGYRMPTSNIVINMAPADIRKEGSAYDLPLAIGMLGASEVIRPDKLNRYLLMGELSLDGSLQPIKGALPIAIKARELGFEGIIIPKQNTREAAVVNNLKVYGAGNLKEVIEFFNDKQELELVHVDTRKEFYTQQNSFDLDFSDVKGQENVKRALEVAAAGGHNILLVGAPGSGKSMLAKRLPSILPPLSLGESLETTKIHSVAGKLGQGSGLISKRPFRDPHHTISTTAMTGGGSFPQPGEISLAHNGVLFLDELPEFDRRTLETLRQPLEDGIITISRAQGSVSYPCDIMLVAAMNPCPCGNFGNPKGKCTCSQNMIQNYLGKISRPVLDRIDIQVEMPQLSYEEISSAKKGEPSSAVLERIMKAREIQQKRFEGTEIRSNSKIPPAYLHEMCPMDENAKKMLSDCFDKMGLSARAYDRILKVARTCADLAGSEIIRRQDISSAVNFRSLDRKYWGAGK